MIIFEIYKNYKEKYYIKIFFNVNIFFRKNTIAPIKNSQILDLINRVMIKILRNWLVNVCQKTATAAM